MLYESKDMYFYCSTHEVNTALDKDTLFFIERKKILEKIKMWKRALSNKTSIVKI